MDIVIEEVEAMVGGKPKKISLYFVEGELEKDLSKYYIIDAFGRRVFIKTKDRMIAQEVVNLYFGNNKYTVKCGGLEKISGTPNVRATEFRRGQAQQRLKAKILNG